ncbi:MAG: TonB-dependent receptor [Sphingomonas sp.]
MNFARKRLAIACLPLIALQWPAYAYAQSTPDAEDSTQGKSSDIVVTGEVERNRTDIDLKRNHANAYDSLSGDDIHAMPDISLADAFRRLPGITGIVDAFSSDFDSGVTNHLTARGLSGSYNLVTFDDLVLATAGGASYGSSGSSTSRDVGLGNFPSTSVKRIEVVSSFSADINGEASGAYFNVVSGSAYDSKKPSSLRVAGNLGYNGPNHVPDFNNPDGSRSGISDNVNFTAATRFGSSEQFGIIATGVFSERRWDTETFLRDGNNVVTFDGASVANPSQIRPNDYSNYQKQYGGTLKFEFKPSSNFYSDIYGLYYRKNQHTVRNANVLTALGTYTNADADDGSWAKATGSVFLINEPIQYANSLIAWHTEWEPADRHEINLNAGWSTATQDQQYTQITYATTSTTSLGGTFEQGPDSFSYTLNNPVFFLTPANYKNTAYYDTDTHNVGVTKMAKLDYGFNQGRRDHGLGYKIGASYIDMMRKNSTDEFDYTATGTGQLVGNAQTLIVDPQHLAGAAYGALYIDPDAVINSRTWTGKEAVDNLANDWRFEEYDAAGYAMLTWKSATLQANAGLRYEHTVQTSQNYDTTTYDPRFNRGRYDALLPSATLLFDPLQGLRLRASFSKTLGRPTPGEVSLPGAVKTTDPNGDLTITGGNPNLKPRRLNNYDVGAEYYWDNGDSMASVTLFQKNISDDIFNTSEPEVIDGITYTYTTPHNADKSRIRGVVAQIVKNHFDFLPGPFKNLGGLLNGTFTDAYTMWHSGANVIRFDNMVGQSKWAGNVTLFYQIKDAFQARVSYNYRSRYNYAFSTNGSFVSGYGQLDLGLRYNLKTNIVLSADARNLTNSDYQRTYANYPRLYQSTNYGQTFTLGVTARFN